MRRAKAIIGSKDHEAIMGKDSGEPVSCGAVLFYGFGETVSGVKGRVAF
jgi:hypothetical protein